ncbi:MAG: PD-(D/E)XK nuclease family protein [Dysgonamonadaceae bacterium]
MKPFLYNVAEIFYREYGNKLYQTTFVFPNRRAGVFFRKYLAEIAGKPIFSPTVITVQELFEMLSDKQPADKIEMLVLLYKQFRIISGSEESFDDFLYWGELLLNDFNDVDKHMVDARQLFSNVEQLKSMEGDMSYLSPEQIVAIRRFWDNFMPVKDEITKKHFLETWQILYQLYTSFKDELLKKGMAYEGMIFREVAERARLKEELKLSFQKIVFVGLNALTTSEVVLMRYLRDRDVADFYWDYDSPLVCDEQNKASFWIKTNLNQFPSKFDIHEPDESNAIADIDVIGVPSAVGQAKQVGTILSQLVDSGAISDPQEAINTAIVLPDENLLLPVIYSIPETIEKINVTMGYGLSHSSVSSLMEHVSLLHKNIRQSNGETAFYYRHVLSILNHPLVQKVSKNGADKVKAYILSKNRVVVPLSQLQEGVVLTKIFQSVTDWQEVPDYLHDILGKISSLLSVDKEIQKETENDTRPIDLELEFIVQYYKTITRLQDTLSSSTSMSVETWFRLLKKLTLNISVPFSGEPLSGLQVMGVLETRVIDFENIIILSMNEGVFPLKQASTSFIPYNLRKGFGLPTYEHQDSTYAYHFYRMISRAKRVFMLYDTRMEDMQSGEVSRYVYQLKYLYPNQVNLREYVANYDVTAPETLPVSVEKSAVVLEKLKAFCADGEKSLSASSINTYINCPLQFYFTAVEGLSEEEEVQESVESSIFGLIFHRIMEKMYNRYKGQTVTPDVLTALAADDKLITQLLEQTFAEYYFKDKEHPQSLEGQLYLIGEILRSYVKQTLELDKQFTPFDYIGSEHRFKDIYPVNAGLKVNFKGSIDRIDKVNDSYRIIDYKSGKGDLNFNDLSAIFDASKAKRPYQILQVLIYCLFYDRENSARNLSPSVYYLLKIFSGSNHAVTYQNQPINDFAKLLPEFTDKFNRCIEDIFNPEIPFSQTQNDDNCTWCAFKDVCGKSKKVGY